MIEFDATVLRLPGLKNITSGDFQDIVSRHHDIPGLRHDYKIPRKIEPIGGKYKIQGGDSMLFERQKNDQLLTELAEIKSIWGKQPFIDAYNLAQHTFDEADKEWDIYLREERKRQAILNEG